MSFILTSLKLCENTTNNIESTRYSRHDLINWHKKKKYKRLLNIVHWLFRFIFIVISVWRLKYSVEQILCAMFGKCLQTLAKRIANLFQ